MRILRTVILFTGIVGAICLSVAAQSPSYVDTGEFRVEPFSWMAAGEILILIAAVSSMIAAGVWILRRAKRLQSPHRVAQPTTSAGHI
jgi:hypothetical protein